MVTLTQVAERRTLARSTTVLLVDDDRETNELLAEILREEGYAVDCAHDGWEALAQVARHRPQVILLDLVMPGMSGWEFIDELRARLPQNQPPIILLSGVGSVAQDAVRLHVQGYLRKPLGADDVVRAVRRQAAGLHTN
jgi:CheY-like chemotaxis protein